MCKENLILAQVSEVPVTIIIKKKYATYVYSMVNISIHFHSLSQLT